MKCHECGKTLRERKPKEYRYRESGLNNVTLTGIRVFECPEGHGEFPEIPNIVGFHQAIARMLAKKPAALTGAEFRFLRKEMGLKAKDLARHLGRQGFLLAEYPHLGFNYRMTDVQAAIGRVQLSRLPEMLARRRAMACRYHARLGSIRGLGLPFVPEYARPNWQTYCVRLPEGRDQLTVMQALLDAGIATRSGVMCAHREAAYPRDTWSCGADRDCDRRAQPCTHLANSEAAQDRTLALPLFDGLSCDDQDRVVSELVRACAARA